MKRIVYAFFALIFLIFSVIIPDFSSFATDITVSNTFGDLAYGYTSEDLLFEQNYIDNFSVDPTKEYLKYCCTYGSYFVHNNNSDMGSNIMSNMINSWNNNTYLQDTTFPDDLNGVHITQLYYYDYAPHLANIVVESDDLIIINGTLCSSQPFRYHAYYYNINNAGGSAYTNLTDYGIGTENTINSDGYYSITMSNRLQWNLFSEVPIYLTAMKDNNYPDGDFLVDDYNYDSVTNIYNAVKNNTDDTGFIIDRRTEKMINGDNAEDDLLNDVDLMEFEGDLGFEYFDFKGYITENQGLIFPNYIVNYKLNNYTDLRKENIEIYADYSFDFKLTFQMAGNQMYGYQSANMGTMGFMDMLPVNQNTYGMDLNAYMDDNTFVNYRETSGLHLQSNGIRDYENIQNFNPNSMIADFGRYFYQIMNNVSANKVVNSKRDSYFYITCEFWIEYVDENGRRIQSNKIIRKIDYWGDSSYPSSILTPAVTDVDSSGIIDDDQAYHDFI